MNKIGKFELVEKMVELGLTKTKADGARAVDAFIGAVEASLREGNDITLVGFGTFKNMRRAARTARNPQTGAAVAIPERTLPKFVMSKKFAR